MLLNEWARGEDGKKGLTEQGEGAFGRVGRKNVLPIGGMTDGGLQRRT